MTRTRLRQFTLGAFVSTATVVAVTLGLSLSSSAQAASPHTALVRASATRAAAPGLPALAPGQASWRIRVVKQILHVPSRSDVYGLRLRPHVVRFKRAHHLAPTATIGLVAWHRLKYRQGVERIVHKRHAIIRVAHAHVGDPYVYGAAGPHAFDCSGYVQYVYRHATGRVLPRVGSAQFAVGRPESAQRSPSGRPRRVLLRRLHLPRGDLRGARHDLPRAAHRHRGAPAGDLLGQRAVRPAAAASLIRALLPDGPDRSGLVGVLHLGVQCPLSRP